MTIIHKKMSSLETMPWDMIGIIFSNITEREKVPLRFVSKRMRICTKRRKGWKYYYDFINETVRKGETNIFRWLCEIGYFGDKETCKLIIKYDRIEMLSDAFKNRWDPDEIDICSYISDNGSMEMMQWALKAGHKISPFDHPFIPKQKYDTWKKWGDENDCILDEYDPDFYYEMRGPLLEDSWEETRKHIHTCKDIEKVRRFIMEKARDEIRKEERDDEYYACCSWVELERAYEELKNNIYGVDDICAIVRFADVHFGGVSEFVEDSTDDE